MPEVPWFDTFLLTGKVIISVIYLPAKIVVLGLIKKYTKILHKNKKK